jgi:hypothetical protein
MNKSILAEDTGTFYLTVTTGVNLEQHLIIISTVEGSNVNMDIEVKVKCPCA